MTTPDSSSTSTPSPEPTPSAGPNCAVATGSPPYGERDAMQLDHDGGYYYSHVHAMTQYGLHSKSDIAAELGFRDRAIDHWRQKHRALVRELVNLEDLSRNMNTTRQDLRDRLGALLRANDQDQRRRHAAADSQPTEQP